MTTYIHNHPAYEALVSSVNFTLWVKKNAFKRTNPEWRCMPKELEDIELWKNDYVLGAVCGYMKGHVKNSPSSIWTQINRRNAIYNMFYYKKTNERLVREVMDVLTHAPDWKAVENHVSLQEISSCDALIPLYRHIKQGLPFDPSDMKNKIDRQYNFMKECTKPFAWSLYDDFGICETTTLNNISMEYGIEVCELTTYMTNSNTFAEIQYAVLTTNKLDDYTAFCIWSRLIRTEECIQELKDSVAVHKSD